ncbi:polymeric immunoglobulin receptor-like [Brachyhypopomus gauderio]|uniref:polymeric immunoglobulin receptor-like n=1 Tax=Brachyhypopomus gauderio TaxID=698409 RepID=UPI00404231BC
MEDMFTLLVSGEEGSSVSVQCLYSAAYQNKQKQWCRSTDWSCYTVGKTHTSQNSAVWIREGIRSFKVEMTGLKKSDAGWYWCSVGDVQVPVHLTVNDALTAPAVSVLGSRVSGEEGSSVSVQCLYSAAYQNKQKQWCRSTDWSCYTVGRTHTSQNSAVWIREGIRSFTVVMTGLKKSDAGWYWCSVGDVQVPVHLTVTDALRGIVTVRRPPTGRLRPQRLLLLCCDVMCVPQVGRARHPSHLRVVCLPIYVLSLYQLHYSNYSNSNYIFEFGFIARVLVCTLSIKPSFFPETWRDCFHLFSLTLPVTE